MTAHPATADPGRCSRCGWTVPTSMPEELKLYALGDHRAYDCPLSDVDENQSAEVQLGSQHG